MEWLNGDTEMKTIIKTKNKNPTTKGTKNISMNQKIFVAMWLLF